MVFNTGYSRGCLARCGPKLFEDGVSKKTPRDSQPRELKGCSKGTKDAWVLCQAS